MSGQLGTFLLGSVLVVTIADAPDWQLRPYIALLGLGVILAMVEPTQPKLSKGLASLILIGLLIQRGDRLATRVTSIVGK